LSVSLAELLKKGELTIAVIGLGRIGLPTAVMFAEAGAKVIGVDINPSVVDKVNRCETRFVGEPGSMEALIKVVNQGKAKGGFRRV